MSQTFDRHTPYPSHLSSLALIASLWIEKMSRNDCHESLTQPRGCRIVHLYARLVTRLCSTTPCCIIKLSPASNRFQTFSLSSEISIRGMLVTAYRFCCNLALSLEHLVRNGPCCKFTVGNCLLPVIYCTLEAFRLG